MELIQQQKREIENLKATQSHQSKPATVGECYLTSNVLSVCGQKKKKKKTTTDNKDKGGKKFVGTPRPPNHLWG